MKKQLSLLTLLLVFSLKSFAQQKKEPLSPFLPTTSSNPIIGCSVFTNPSLYTCASSYSFAAPVNNSDFSLPSNTNIGCFGSTPNQSWFIVTVTSLSSNTLTFTQNNSNSVDVDAVIWGPLLNNNNSNACLATANAPLACDFNSDAETILTFGNVAVGNKYVMLVTNYSNSATTINIPQPSGGTVQYCRATPNACVIPTATLSGTQTIANGSSANLSISFTGISPWAYSINNGGGSGTTSNNPNTVSVSPSSTTTYNLTSVSNTCGSGTVAGLATVTVSVCGQNRNVTLSGSKSILQGQSANLELNTTGTLPYNYSISNIGSGIATNNPFLVNIIPFETTSYNLLSASNSCDNLIPSGSATVVTQLPTTIKKLVSCFSFDNNVLDQKGINYAYNYGAVPTSDRYGNTNSAYFFNGYSSIDITSTELINNEYSWCAWVKPTSLPSPGNVQILFSLGGNGGDQSFAINNNYFTNTGNLPRWILGNYYDFQTVGPFETVNEIITPNQWYYISAIRSRDSLSVYVNGDLKSKIYSGGRFPYYGNSLARIGMRYTSNQGFVGAMDDIKFFNSTLNKDEVKLLYLSNLCDFEFLENRKVELVSCYSFNGNANDGVNLNHGVVNGATLTSDRFGNSNKAYLFNGSSYINLPAESFKNNNYSISLWVSPSSITNTIRSIMSIGNTGGFQSLKWTNSTLGSQSFQYISSLYSDSYGSTAAISSPSQVLNNWYHLVLIREPHRIKLYLNGILVSESSTNNYVNAYYGVNNLGFATIGSKLNSEFFEGKIDDIKIFNGALFDAEIMALFNETSVGGCNYKTCEPIKLISQLLSGSNIVSSGKKTIGINIVNSNANVTYLSKGSVELQPGFKTENGSVFRAEASGCAVNN